MKNIKLLSFLLGFACFFLLGSVLSAQSIPNNPNLTDKEGKRQGQWTILYDKGWNVITDTANVAYYRLIAYQDDKPVGIVKDLYRDGRVQMEATLLADRPQDIMDGVVIYYDEEGNKEKEAIYNKGQLESEKSLLDPNSWKALDQAAGKALEQGQYETATKLFERVREQAEKEFGKITKTYGNACNDLGLVYLLQGKYEEAELLLLEAREIQERVVGKEGKYYSTSCLINLGALYLEQGLYTKAEPLLIEAKNIRANLYGQNSPTYAVACSRLGILYYNQRLYEKAETLFIEVKNIRESASGKNSPDYANSCNDLAVIYRDQRKFSEAEALFVEAKEAMAQTLGREHPNYAACCGNLGFLYQMQGLYEKAEALFMTAKDIQAKTSGTFHPDYAQSCIFLASLYQEQGLYAKAEPLYLEVVNTKIAQISSLLPTFSESEKMSYLASIRNVFNGSQDWAIAYSKEKPSVIGELYNQNLFMKSLVFSSTQKMRKQILGSGDSTLIADFENWKNQKSSYNKLLEKSGLVAEKDVTSLDSMATAINQLEKSLSKRSTLFAQNVQTKNYQWQQVKQKLGKNQVVIEIIRTLRTVGYDSLGGSIQDTIYVALFLTNKTKKQPEMLILENGKDLESKHLSFYKNAIQFKLKDANSYLQYWQPIASKLKQLNKKGFAKIYFSPDGVYHQISLNTLQDPENEQFVLENQNIQLIGTSRDLIELGTKEKDLSQNFENYQAYLVGFPTYNLEQTEQKTQVQDRNFSAIQKIAGRQVSVLYGTKREVEAIAEFFNQKKLPSQIYIKEKASEGNLKKLVAPTILHIATHGFFIPPLKDKGVENMQEVMRNKVLENPLWRSGLLLAGCENPKAEGEDGVLTAEEALSLNLDNTELVVLSACETGLGDIQNGEGVFGLQRAFQQAGAKTVLMSLWKVSDEATQMLMTEFYKNLLAGKTKRQAFLSAQLALKAQFPEPYYWGAFVMVGE
ncbi:CHAT domain-containing protein [Hugenholtzia roseola]|uniref:CHAT domain-containing protein n=1 Tax=Hugenholtzia roseola TaxID=1002 RepID=UPI00042A7ABE|nr:CHAT domain-containing protein [Hugenholtzia roseola]